MKKLIFLIALPLALPLFGKDLAIQGTLDMPPIDVAGDLCYNGGSAKTGIITLDPPFDPYPQVCTSVSQKQYWFKNGMKDQAARQSKDTAHDFKKSYNKKDEKTAKKWLVEVMQRIHKIVEISKDVHDRMNRAKKLTYIEILKTKEQISYLSKRIDIDRVRNENLREDIGQTFQLYKLIETKKD